MSSNSVEIKLISEGIKELLQSSEVMAVCRSEGEKIASQYGGDAEISEYISNNRANVAVRTSSSGAMDDNKLLKAVY